MKKGFTLIELLAVIVILAIIALIATPIILGIINDARKESNERSAELYASAVRNAIASYQLTHPNAPKSFEDLDIEHDGNVVCATEELYEDGSFYIANCTVNGTAVDYTYGEKQDLPYVQVYKPQYYSWDFSGDVGTTSVSSNPSSVPPTGKNFYLGYDVDSDNKVSAAYVCFTKDDIEYCLKGNDRTAYETNKKVLEEAFDKSACSFDDYESYCRADGLSGRAYAGGHVDAWGDGDPQCYVNLNGSFVCNEF